MVVVRDIPAYQFDGIFNSKKDAMKFIKSRHITGQGLSVDQFIELLTKLKQRDDTKQIQTNKKKTEEIKQRLAESKKRYERIIEKKTMPQITVIKHKPKQMKNNKKRPYPTKYITDNKDRWFDYSINVNVPARFGYDGNILQPSTLKYFYGLCADLFNSVANRYEGMVGSKVSFVFRTHSGDVLSIPFSNWNSILRLCYSKLKELANAYQDYKIDNIILKVVVPNQNAMRGASRSETTANAKWVMISPKTKTNCLFCAISICKNWQTNNKLLYSNKARVVAGRKLKYRVKPKQKKYSDDETIQELSDYLGFTIQKYNNIYKLKKTFEPKGKKSKGELEILNRTRDGTNHVVALIRKNEIVNFIDNNKDVDEKILKLIKGEDVEEKGKREQEKEDNEEECYMIKKFPKEKEYNRKIAVYDLETVKVTADDDEEIEMWKSYACGFAWKDDFRCEYEKWSDVDESVLKENLHYKTWYGMNSVTDFLKYLKENIKQFEGYTIYAHNGGKFDMNILIREGLMDGKLFKINDSQCLELNGRWIAFSIRSGDYSINFRDSFAMIQGSLDNLSKDYQVKYAKLTDTINHNLINMDNYNSDELAPQIKKYLKNDCYSLLEIMDVFSKSIYHTFHINPCDCFTASSLSKRIFYQKYYDHKKQPLYKLARNIDENIRKSYSGGRVECFQMGKIKGKIYYYDFTSLYPYCGTKMMPCGEPKHIDFSKKENAVFTQNGKLNFFGFVHCKVKGKEDLPLHAVKNCGKLYFRNFKEWQDVWLFSEEIKLSQQLKLNYKYKFIEGYQFKRASVTKDFFGDIFKLKAQYKKEGKDTLSNAVKIILNSGYGFFGIKTHDRDGVLIGNVGELNYYEYLQNNKLVNYMEHDGVATCRVKKDLDIRDDNIAIASAIASYGRMETFQLMHSIKKVGGKVYYCDTDSVMCNVDVNKYPELQERFQWDKKGDDLGCIKNECEGKASKLVKKGKMTKQQFEKQMKHDENQMYFTELIVTGLKQYYVEKKFIFKDVQPISVATMKGFRQSKYWSNDKQKYIDQSLDKKKYLKMVEGEEILNYQNQIRVGKQDYVNEDNPFSVRYAGRVKKSFSMQYHKGIVEKDGTVTPFYD